MNILITGGSGFLGKHLTKKLNELGHTVSWLTRTPNKYKDEQYLANAYSYEDLNKIDPQQVVINLAGAGIADKRWSQARKKQLYDSRIQTTKLINEWMLQQKQLPTTYISGSAIGWYGCQQEQQLTEKSNPVSEFQHELCHSWELQALEVADKINTFIIRTGVVLHPSGGMLAKIKTPFSFGLGGRLGSGNQYLSWISLDDWLSAMVFLVDNKAKPAIYNVTAPNPVSNSEFTKKFAGAFNKPAFFHVPSFILKGVLGEMSCLLLQGQRVYPNNLIQAGFEFQHANLTDALQDYF